MIKKFSFFIAFIWSVFSFGQVVNTSPYSYFGIGEDNHQTSVASNSMGGINVAMNYKSELNFSNPAAQSALQYTVFSIAGKTKFLQVNDSSDKQNTSYTSLSSLALGIPIGKKAGLMVGLQPNSNVGYVISEEIYNTEDEIIESNTFNGSGGTNRFFGSFGYQVTKNFSLGIEGAYYFGNIENSIINQRLDVMLNTKHRLISNITGTSLKFGSQFNKTLKNNLELKVGATVKFQNILKAKSEEYLYSFDFGSISERPRDTIVNNTNINGEITQPLSLTVGVGIGKSSKWYLGVEYEEQDAMNFDESIFQNNNKVKYASSSRYSLGGFWIPKKNSITSYWHRVVYRAGLKYENAGLAVNGSGELGDFTSINDFGISFGLGLPIGNQLSQVNLGLEYGNRGNTTKGLIKENYFNLRLSLDLADKWFRKHKIN